jgi:hypothetical protein
MDLKLILIYNIIIFDTLRAQYNNFNTLRVHWSEKGLKDFSIINLILLELSI